MARSLSRSIPRIFLLGVLFIPGTPLTAQTPSASALRGAQSEVERQEARVSQIIARAESLFKQGELNLRDNRREQARDDFDKAVDVILESGLDVRANPRLRDYYLQLVERIYRLEVPQSVPTRGGETLVAQAASPQIGFRQQTFEPSPLDELSRLTLTPEEENVSPEDVAQLEAAKSAVNFNFKINPLIQQFINYYQGRGRATMEAGLRRSGRYMKLARRIFREEGVPEDLAWLAQVESAWQPLARSWAGASGLWQFVPGTGLRYGLRQTAWVDERHSFEKATRASARYLKWLAQRYGGNWELALAAYNTGEGNIDRAIARVGAADFWQIYPYIAQETRNYVPNILATILIAKNPEKYGFAHVKPEPPLSYDTVSVPPLTSLRFIAEATETSLEYLRDLNPELRRDTTPQGESYAVRVPPGRGRSLVALLKRIPPDQRNSIRFARVAPGENLATIAARTGANLSQLQALNEGVEIKPGSRILVPAGSVKNVVMTRPTAAGNVAPTKRLVRIRARQGETVAQIAARYGASADEVARLNGVAANSPLAAGREIVVPASGGVKSSAAPRRRRR
ncbi:transglycosylase SLT domain-containing protein [Pyrinomonas sp.]|uniref:lytic transglycosylase domain-containing protein n=1 Tax=Pyrinomonas sp. TaxID=2080306 RepID=UPI00332957A0